jgi:hypothetical protein
MTDPTPVVTCIFAVCVLIAFVTGLVAIGLTMLSSRFSRDEEDQLKK